MTATEQARAITNRYGLGLNGSPIESEIAAAIREAERDAYARGKETAHEECAQMVERLAVQFGNKQLFDEVVACAVLADAIRQRKDQ